MKGHTMSIDEAGDAAFVCPANGDGPCTLLAMDGPDTVTAVNRFGLLALGAPDWPDLPMLPPGEDEEWDCWWWDSVASDLSYEVEFREWHEPTGDCGLAEGYFAGLVDDVPTAPGTYDVEWGEFEDWGVTATFLRRPDEGPVR